ncbi:hypothetical protein [Alterinioella nitratireducens]|uniref:hypothetical protein n=1 Tax=Alterinioella nitratireducens TaxID=2735915 RepID=UPI001556FC97|nr:hypothetical protein [Alterinioella nitratireducens]NPD21291.1 hypothetical protein [Alterinioella nitratireducens]
MKCLAIFSFARSGTNYLSDLLHEFENVRSYREIFQPRGVHLYNSNTQSNELKEALEKVGASYKIRDCTVRSSELIEAVHADPNPMMNTIINESLFSEKPYCAFKIFGGHLTEAKIQDSILRRKDFLPIVFRRNPLDTFISAYKVKFSKSAIAVDTTQIKPSLSFNQYMAWRKNRKNWIDLINRNAEKFIGMVSFDELMKLDSDVERLNTLASIFKVYGADLITSKRAQLARRTEKQDQSSSPGEKVSNLPEFISECADHGIDPQEEPIPFRTPNLM